MSVIRSPFEGRDFSPLEYDDMVALIEELGIEYGDSDPVMAHDVYKLRIKKIEARENKTNG